MLTGHEALLGVVCNLFRHLSLLLGLEGGLQLGAQYEHSSVNLLLIVVKHDEEDNEQKVRYLIPDEGSLLWQLLTDGESHVTFRRGDTYE